eukprot:11124664-Alexandrium_andersonii.AAC.1
MEAKSIMEKDAGKPLSATACAEAWKTNITLNRKSEPVKESFIDAVFCVWDRLMHIPRTASAR